jgi:hypothetical protein
MTNVSGTVKDSLIAGSGKVGFSIVHNPGSSAMRTSIYRGNLLLFLGVFVPALCWNTLAISAGDNSPVLPKYEVAGFRDVRFGMTEPEVRAAATKAFGLKAFDLTGATNPIEGTSEGGLARSCTGSGAHRLPARRW